MANPNKEKWIREAREMFMASLTTATLEQKSAFLLRVSPVEHSLRAFYNRHQKTGCECERCKTAESVFAWIDKLGEVEKPKPDK